MHDLIEHCVAVTVLCTPPQRCIRGHVGVFRSYAVAWPRLCARLSPLPLCRTLSGAAAESAQYDRVKHDMCVTKMRARDWPRTMPRTTKHRGARPGSNPSRRDPGDGVSLSVTSNANGRGAIALGCQVRRTGSRRVRSLFRRTLGLYYRLYDTGNVAGRAVHAEVGAAARLACPRFVAVRRWDVRNL